LEKLVGKAAFEEGGLQKSFFMHDMDKENFGVGVKINDAVGWFDEMTVGGAV